MANNSGSSKRACATKYFRCSSLLGYSVHDSAPIYRPILIKFGTDIQLAKDKNKFFRQRNQKWFMRMRVI